MPSNDAFIEKEHTSNHITSVSWFIMKSMRTICLNKNFCVFLSIECHFGSLFFNAKNRKRKGELLQKTEEISRSKAYTNTRKLNWNISMNTDAFLDQKRVNVCEHMVKTAPRESFWKVPPGRGEDLRGWRENWMEIIWG